MKTHPTAARFPIMGDDELAALADDIKKNGLIEPIVTTADSSTLIDGRNRLKACTRAEVKPHFHKLSANITESEIINFIISKNMERRDLNPGQRAVLAVELSRDEYAAAAKERMLNGKKDPVAKSPQGRARELIAAQFGIGSNTVGHAIKVLDEAPALAKRVLGNEVSLNDAYQQVRQREAARPTREASKRAGKTVTLLTHLGQEVLYPLPQGKPTFNPTNEHISWAAWSWNPVTGCLHGCPYCYARELANLPSYKASYPVGFTPLFHHERLSAPSNMTVPEEAKRDSRLKRVFVCSMADLYGKWVPNEWIEQVHTSCIDNPQWDYLMLTKFPRRYVDMKLPKTAWLGTSVDEQKRVRLAEEAFRQIKGVRVKWLSLEPLLAPLKFTDLSMFDWVVIGSQTATEQPGGKTVAEFAPPFEWVARLVAQAREAGCRIYLKPNLVGETGPQAPGMELMQEEPLIK